MSNINALEGDHRCVLLFHLILLCSFRHASDVPVVYPIVALPELAVVGAEVLFQKSFMRCI